MMIAECVYLIYFYALLIYSELYIRSGIFNSGIGLKEIVLEIKLYL